MRLGTFSVSLAVKDIAASRLKEQGVALASEADPEGKGPASLVVVDPDGNPVLIDQHVPGPMALDFFTDELIAYRTSRPRTPLTVWQIGSRFG
jgi:hypothetical protein